MFNRRTVAFLFMLMTLNANAHGQAVPVKGEVTRINLSDAKVTLRHGPIPNLDMDGMSGMVFALLDPSMLAGLKPGDRVIFEAERVNGRLTVTKIGKARK